MCSAGRIEPTLSQRARRDGAPTSVVRDRWAPGQCYSLGHYLGTQPERRNSAMIHNSLWWSKWRRNRYEKKTNSKIKALRAAKKYDEANELEHELQDELMSWEQSLWSRRTIALVKEAKRLDVPVNYDKEVWRTSEEQDRYLTPQAQHDLHKAIRQEKDDRITHRMKLVKEVVIPIVTFILGLITAYVAMKRNH